MTEIPLKALKNAMTTIIRDQLLVNKHLPRFTEARPKYVPIDGNIFWP